MRHIYYDRRGVSNAIGYLLSFIIASTVMVSAVIVTTGIINDRTNAVVKIEAQSVANKVADAIVEAISVKQSMAEAEYKKILDIPVDLAGRNYYIEITNKQIYVNTTDGQVSRSCTTYGAEGTNIGVSASDRIYSGTGKLNISCKKADYIYKFDFGTGNISVHSPVESGYYMVSNISSTDRATQNPSWWDNDYQNRVPILVNNTSPYDLNTTPIKIVLNPKNFDYSRTNVTVKSPSEVVSDLVFYDPNQDIVADITISPYEWEPEWFYNNDMDTIQVTINGISQYGVSYIDKNTFKLNDKVNWASWVDNTVSFSRKEALESLENGDHFLDHMTYTVTVSGLFKNGVFFRGSKTITIKGSMYVDDDNIEGPWDGTPEHPYRQIKHAIINTSNGDTVFVRKGIYNEYVNIVTEINVIGEDNLLTIIDGKQVVGGLSGVVRINKNNVNIDSFWIKNGSINPTTLNGISITSIKQEINISNCNINDSKNGIVIATGASGSSYIDISNCNCFNNAEDGIRIRPTSSYVRITNSDSYNNRRKGLNISSGPSHHITVINCVFRDNTGDYENGINITGGHDISITESSIYNNNYKGLSISDGAYNIYITNCSINSNTNNGINITQSNSITIRDCLIWSNGNSGISICHSGGEGTPVEILKCESCYNYNGIYLYHSDNNNIQNCSLYWNYIDGIQLRDSNYNIIKYCNCYDNYRHGLVLGKDVGYSNYNTIQNNNFYTNGRMYYGVGVLCVGTGAVGIGSKGNNINNNNFGNDTVSKAYKKHALDNYNSNGDHPNDWSSNFWYNDTVGTRYRVPSNFTFFTNNDTNPCGPDWNNAFDNPDETYTTIGSPYEGNQYHYHTTTIQKALDNVRPHGKVHVIRNSTVSYLAGGIINKPLTLIGEGFGRNVEINLNSELLNGFTINADNVSIRGFTIKGGNNGILIDESNYVKIQECEMRENNNGIYITSFSNQNNITDCEMHYNNYNGIYIYDDSNRNTISSCKMDHNSKNGLYIKDNSNKNTITKCDVENNNEHGINIENSNENIIINCTDPYYIYENKQSGLYIKNGDDNKIANCEFSYNDWSGIEIRDSSTGNDIENCTIRKNENNGIYISSSDTNKVINCSIEDNDDYGIYITGSGSNKIYHNKFENNGYGTKNAYDDSTTNTWDNGYPSGGNRWSDYDDNFDDPPAKDDNGDGIADIPYDIPGGNRKDNYPRCRTIIVIPYYIDYWNPLGESIILLNITKLDRYTSKLFYLYYGYDEDKPSTRLHNHNISQVSVFFDDFNNLDLSQWDTSGIITLNQGCVNIPDNGYIFTKTYSIPEVKDPLRPAPPTINSSDSMYIVEARMKLEGGGQSNMILMAQSNPPPYNESYIFSANSSAPAGFYLHKFYDNTPLDYVELQKLSTPILDQWIGMKSYIYQNKTCYYPSDIWLNKTILNGYIYHYGTFSNQGNVSATDTYNTSTGDPPGEKATGSSYLSGKIGVGSGLIPNVNNGNILVDWIRVMKTPIAEPTIVLGAMESANYGWENNENVYAENIIVDSGDYISNPFTPGPVLRDFNYGTSDSTLIIKNIPAGEYTITATMGKINDICNLTSIDFNFGYEGIGYTYLGKLTIPETANESFETKWLLINIPSDSMESELGTLKLTFHSDISWTVNSILIERGNKGIIVSDIYG